MRTVFARCLLRAAQADPRLVLLPGESSSALLEFRQACPQQYRDPGAAEANVGVAAELARGGQRPVVYGPSPLLPLGVLGQLERDLTSESLPILFVGDGAAARPCATDVSVLRALPGLAILSPADEHEMLACLSLALGAAGPVYLRLGAAHPDPVHLFTPQLDWGRLCLLRAGSGELAWIATGALVGPTLAAAAHWPDSAVWSAPCLKPLRSDGVKAVCDRHRAVVVLEEHSVHGGLGSAVAEIACAEVPTWVCRIGIPDPSAQRSADGPEEAPFTPEAIVARVRRFLARTTPGGRRAA